MNGGVEEHICEERPPRKDNPVLIEKPNQPPGNYQFPKTRFGNQSRSVQCSWFNQYPWLHYSQSEDLLYCYICVNQFHKGNLKSTANVDQAFTTKGFANWKKALSTFKTHQASQCHATSVELELVIPKTNHDIIDLTNKNSQKHREDNRRCLAVIIESLQYLARQGIPIRGHNDSDSNFVQLVKLRARDVSVLDNWINNRTQNYLSHEIQNELLHLMSAQVLRGLIQDIGNNYFSIICDEYTDISNKEQLTVCVRWVDNDINAYEDFLGFYKIPDISANTITSVIKDSLLRLSLSLERCRGQCFDGASNMLGKKSGVAKQIQDIQPKAFPTHCHAHSLSLGVKDTVKACKILSDTMNTSKEIITLIKYSPKRETMLGEEKENIEIQSEVNDEHKDPQPGIVTFCPTRWTVTAECYKRILDNYEPLMKVWDASLLTNLKPDIKARIIGCQTQMKTFAYFFGLNLGQRLFAHTDNLSKSLQSPSLSATAGQNLARLTVSTLRSIRDDQSFQLLYESILLKAQQHPSVVEPTLPRKRRAPTRYETGSSEHTYPDTVQDHYRRIYFEVIDHLVNAIGERFNQPAFLIYHSLEDLLLKAIKGDDTSKEMKTVISTFTAEVSETVLEAQLATFRIIMDGSNNQIKCFSNILEKIKTLNDHERCLINQVITLCKIMLVIPATSASAERSFSTARRLKTWLRSQMGQSRFNDICILNTHKKRLDDLPLLDIANQFVSLNENRKRNFGKMSHADF